MSKEYKVKKMCSLLVSLFLISSVFFIPSHAESKGESFRNEMKISSKPCQEPHFVLVHGYGGGAWCWYKIISLMEAAGYNATSLDLKGVGTDLTDSSTVHTFEDYNKPLIDFLEKLPDDEKVILVGHSAGGLSITDASYKFSNKIQVAVYVAATMLEHGYATEQDVKDGFPDLLRKFSMEPKIRRGRYMTPRTKSPNSKIRQIISQEGFPDLPRKYSMEPKIKRGRYMTERIKSPNSKIRQIISQEDAILKRILFRPVPFEAILSARFEGTEDERVKRVYIKTLNDKIALPQNQDAMIQRWPPTEVFEVECDHDIITSDPFVLFDLLVKVANSIKCN